MTQSLATAALALGPDRLNTRAARVMTDEFRRHPGPKSGLVIGAGAGSPVLAAVLDGLLPDDSVTVVATAGGVEPVGAEVAARGGWIKDRVRVVESLADASPADAVIVATPLAGTADGAHALFEALRGLVAPGGVLSIAVEALPGTGTPALDEVHRQVAAYGVASDLVLRCVPPVRVHRLRFTPALAAHADDLEPAYRSSSVPLRPDMHVDANGVAAFGVCVGLAALARRLAPGSRAWLLPAAAAVPVAAFFRDPERLVPEDPAAIVGAADGKVLSVERVTDERFGGEGDWLRIAVFLSILDVHVNRSPVAGRIVDSFIEDGGYAAAMKPAAEHNVAAYTVLDTAHGRVVVAQRTGLVARRIVRRLRPGALVARGERFGLIRFGSRTDVYLPVDAATPLVAPGDRVVGGTTVIARWR